jgi:hypothetical protein
MWLKASTAVRSCHYGPGTSGVTGRKKIPQHVFLDPVSGRWEGCRKNREFVKIMQKTVLAVCAILNAKIFKLVIIM